MSFSSGKNRKGPTKVVVRRLPPDFTLEVFENCLRPLPEHDYIYFVQGEEIEFGGFSRAYINFAHVEDILEFREKFDNYVFLSSKGVEYAAIIEFAPFQKIPKKVVAQRHDVKCGTIQFDQIFIKYVKTLKDNENLANAKPEFDLRITDPVVSETMTPLLKFLAARKSQKSWFNSERKKEYKQRDNSLIFVNSSIKRQGKRSVKS